MEWSAQAFDSRKQVIDNKRFVHYQADTPFLAAAGRDFLTEAGSQDDGGIRIDAGNLL